METIIPLSYSLSIEPDFGKFQFSGMVELTVEAREPSKDIELNVLELDIQDCRVSVAGSSKACDFTVDDRLEILRIAFPEPVSGQFSLLIRYAGSINDKMAGFYRSYYKSREKSHLLCVTQFQESDARRAFPCFDHPAAKAVFRIELIIDRHLTAISNQDVESETDMENDKKRVVFLQSPKMSTYLVFWGIGEFGFINHSEDERVRVAYLPGMAPYVDFGLDFGKKALAYCETYYDIPYPLSKMDLIAVPDFAFGAMENWGAITFRENLLLFYPGVTSRAGAERIAEVIAHEITHQWFGNLVTPAAWKYLWLNESFATYFGFGIVDHYHPDWDTWSGFLLTQTSPALTRDAYIETIPIEIPGGEHVVINTSTAPIIYCKGGSILRQIEGYIGLQAFQKGLRQYLKKFAYDCAASENLWESLESVSDAPVSDIMASWVGQPGFPVITASPHETGLTLTQHRFSYLENADVQACWRIPVTLRVYESGGRVHDMPVLMDAPTRVVELDPDLQKNMAMYKINAGQTGFYRVTYSDEENLNQLGAAVRTQTLPPEDRWGLENDLFAMMAAAAVPPDRYLDFLEHYETETAFLPLMSIGANLRALYGLAGDSFQAKIKEQGCRLAKNLLSDIGFEPQPDEPYTTGPLRDQYLWLGVMLGSGPVEEFSRNQFARLRDGMTVHPDIARSILQAAAFHGDNIVFEWMIQRFETVESEHDRTNILSALGCFRDKEVISKVRDFTLTRVPPRNQSIPVAAMTENPAAAKELWNWYKTEKSVFAQFHPLIHERVFTSIVPVSLELKADDVRWFLSENQIKINPDVVSLTLERLAINQRLRQKLTAL